MRQSFLKNLIALGCAFWLSMAVFSSALAQDVGTYNFASSSGLAASGEKAGYVIGENATTVEGIIGMIIYIVIGLVGVVFMAYMIYGGVTWMTAQGNQEKAKKAGKILSRSIVGLIITLAAYAISYFLINYFWQ